MKVLIFLVSQFWILHVISLLPDKTRNQLFLKYAKEISIEASNDDIFETYLEAIPYNKTKIAEIIKEYDFPESYNFLNETNATINVKNQESCGCCWAMSSTSALAYRYHLKGIEVDLSPQHELSCYIRNCPHGNTMIDSQLSLVKNGTITEECLPFSSEKEEIEECPNTCKDPNIEYKKYYAKNAYNIVMNQNNIYEVTSMIIDQLLTNGPVVTIIDVYTDFKNLSGDDNCTNNVYSYDGVSKYEGGHALTLVGYGFLNDKYYWLTQNSWGNKSCNDGFIKIEFGQVGIGSFAFSEPYIEEEEEETEVMNVKFAEFDNYCGLRVTSDNNLSNWKSQLNIIFNHSNGLKEFDYICGVNKLFNENKSIHCYYEFQNKESYKGVYEYQTFLSIGKGNNFTLDDEFKKLKFTYYGKDTINPLSKEIEGTNNYYFVSEEGSRITFIFEAAGIDHRMTNIIPNKNHIKPLSDCGMSPFNTNNGQKIISYCDIDKEELNYFDDYSKETENSIFMQQYCGVYLPQNIIIYKLDKSKYPVFRIKHFFASYNYKSFISTLLLADVEGSISGFGENKNSFLIFVQIETNYHNYSNIITCYTGNPEKIGENYAITCSLEFTTEEQINNIYLHPYSGILHFDYPFEIIIDDIIKSEAFIPPTPTPDPTPIPSLSEYLVSSSILLILLFGILF